jgi:hypothetical protein
LFLPNEFILTILKKLHAGVVTLSLITWLTTCQTKNLSELAFFISGAQIVRPAGSKKRRPRLTNVDRGHALSPASLTNDFDFLSWFRYSERCAMTWLERPTMKSPSILAAVAVVAILTTACIPLRFLKGGLHRSVDENLTIVGLTQDPKKYLDKEIVFSVRYYKKGDLPCPLGPDYINIIIADRVSYITLNKVWIKKDRASVLGTLKEMETIVMKARVFAVDAAKDPNLEALEIVKE